MPCTLTFSVPFDTCPASHSDTKPPLPSHHASQVATMLCRVIPTPSLLFSSECEPYKCREHYATLRATTHVQCRIAAATGRHLGSEGAAAAARQCCARLKHRPAHPQLAVRTRVGGSVQQADSAAQLALTPGREGRRRRCTEENEKDWTLGGGGAAGAACMQQAGSGPVTRWHLSSAACFRTSAIACAHPPPPALTPTCHRQSRPPLHLRPRRSHPCRHPPCPCRPCLQARSCHWPCHPAPGPCRAHVPRPPPGLHNN